MLEREFQAGNREAEPFGPEMTLETSQDSLKNSCLEGCPSVLHRPICSQAKCPDNLVLCRRMWRFHSVLIFKSKWFIFGGMGMMNGFPTIFSHRNKYCHGIPSIGATLFPAHLEPKLFDPRPNKITSDIVCHASHNGLPRAVSQALVDHILAAALQLHHHQPSRCHQDIAC